MKIKTLLPLLTGTLALAGTATAEEGGSGHYLPGATASFIDALPGREAFAYVNSFAYYDGSGARQFLGGRVAFNVASTAYADSSTCLYETPWKIFGAQYATAITIPYAWMEVEADLQVGNHTLRQRDTVNGLGDIEFLPLMLGWTNGDIKIGATFGFYAPTGEYEKDALANIGKNYWTFEPGLSASWLSHKIGTEVSFFAGGDFSTENDQTHYQSGDILHLDATVAQHLPLLGGLVSAGANAFYYVQLTADSGSGASLGDFEGHTVGVGPVLAYTKKLGRNKTTDIVAELKWLPELNVEHRLKGDTIWFKLALVF